MSEGMRSSDAPADLASIYEAAPVGLAFVDRSLRYVRINERLAAIHNLPVSQHLGRTIREVMGEGAADLIEPLYRRVIDTRQPVIDREARGRSPQPPHDTRVWLSNYYPLVVDDAVVGVNVVVQDVTELKRGEERHGILLRELSHRVANTFQLIAGLLVMQRRSIRDPDSRAVLDSAMERLQSAALVHRRLYRGSSLAGDEALGRYLTELVGELSKALLSGKDCPATLECDAEEGPTVSTDTAITVGLLTTELVTNACKYAFQDDRPGKVLVRLFVEEGSWILSVQDDGVGLGASGSGASGLGMTIVNALSTQIGEGLHTEALSPGVRFSVRIKSSLVSDS
jgi:PAS domain S-box-containing protein